ncbi:NAD(+) diphosphatase [Clostridium polynesiense]|uniref:NAD(+) diphosphatase n=1 Tax=Clostridium polynesiense TaxID=1325933 RepID=UPI00058FB537|nr:NUDIX domain-containing protein [Clostridium polynesiense]
MRYKYCPFCGKELKEKFSYDEGYVPYCEYDDKMYFDLPKPTVVVAVVKEDDILLLKQSYIYKNSKVLISGYVSNGETVEETVYREVREETGIEIKDIKYLGSCCIEDKELLMLTYMAYYKSGELIKSPEVEGAEWINIEDALCQMSEDAVGKKVVNEVLKQIGYEGSNAYRCNFKN